MPDDDIEEKHPVDWEKSIVVTVALGFGILVILALVTLVALALLGPSIGQVHTYYGSL